MDSSEDDAGAATSASCRPSAREKDVPLAEDGDASRHFQHESCEARAMSCGTLATWEDNFDGDSVPSPSTKDTSTEAILDMIDDFIGDPRAPRLPPPARLRVSTPPVRVTMPPVRVTTPPVPSGSHSQHNKQLEEPKQQIITPPRAPSPLADANIEIISESVAVKPSDAECTPQSEILICVNPSIIEELPFLSSSILVDLNESCSTQQAEISENVILNVTTEEPVTAPPSSSVETVQEISDTSECDSMERTVKCVTSSESRDSVTVELAESTSSECSVSESNILSTEPSMSRSPLRRRLIRPVLSDKRPDSTVSSTVDSQTIDIRTVEQMRSDTIAKDVSSSSDAVPNVHGIIIPEEISNVSEISICKAETSTAPSRKIKLVRPKLTQVMSNSERSDNQISSIPVERDRCQSTSSEEISTPFVDTFVETSSSVIPEKSERQEEKLESIPGVSKVEDISEQILETPKDAISNSEAVVTNDMIQRDPQCTEPQEVIEQSAPDCGALPVIEAPVLDFMSGEIQSKDELKESSIGISRKEVDIPSVKLHIIEPVTVNDVEAQCSSIDLERPQSKGLPMVPMGLDIGQSSILNCDQVNRKVFQDVNNSDSREDQKKVPPIKINLTNADHSKKLESSTVIQKSPIVEDETTSSKAEDSEQVPKLTIKLTNKHTEESNSPIPKMTVRPLQPPVEPDIEVHNELVPSVTKLHIKPIENYNVAKHESSAIEQLPNVSNINIQPITKQSEEAIQSLTTPAQPAMEQDTDIYDSNIQIPNVTKINIKPITKLAEKYNEILTKPLQLTSEQNVVDSNSFELTSTVTKLNIKLKHIEKANEPELKARQSALESHRSIQIPTVTKVNIKPIPMLSENDSSSKPQESTTELISNDKERSMPIPNVTKINIKPIPKPAEKLKETLSKSPLPASEQNIEDHQIPNVTKINIKPIPKPSDKFNDSPAKSLRPRPDQKVDDHSTSQQIPSITKINIKPIAKLSEKDNESSSKALQPDEMQKVEKQDTNLQAPSVTKTKSKQSKIVDDSIQIPPSEAVQNDINKKEQIPIITKLNIKPIVKPPEKIYEIHRKSSSSEISESEYSENDETTSTSDQASASDQCPIDAVPKLTIKLGKPGTECEGKFYTEKNVPKFTIKNIQQGDKDDQMKSIISQSDEKQLDKVPKITIKTVGQSLSPKLTIKPIKPPENISKDEIQKLKISVEPFSSCIDVKENMHIPKITIKPVTKADGDVTPKTPKKSTMMCDSSEHIPVVTKINIKPILKPTESGESSDSYNEKVPVVSKLNIKPVIKPKDNEVVSSIEDIPKITKLNIKPLKNPEESSSDKKDCDEMNTDVKDSCIPVVTKLNIKPIVKPVEEEALKDSENQSSETGNSSDEYTDHIPVVTKLNIKPIVKPSKSEEPTKPIQNEQSIPIVTKLNIKPLVKPEVQVSPASPKKESSKSLGNSGIPVLTKLNIKPIVKPEDLQTKSQEESGKPPLLMKINIKNVSESISETEHLHNDFAGKAHSPKMAHSPKATRRSVILERNVEPKSKPPISTSDEGQVIKNYESNRSSPSLLLTECPSPAFTEHSSGIINPVPENVHKQILNFSPKEKLTKMTKTTTTEETVPEHSIQESKTKHETTEENKISKKNAVHMSEVNDKNRIAEHYSTNYSKASILNCTLLKKLLSTTKEVERSPVIRASNCVSQPEKSESSMSNCKQSKPHDVGQSELLKRLSPKSELKHSTDEVKIRPIEEVRKDMSESVTKPLEIVTDKMANQSSGQDSPRIILKINKTDHGASSKIITEETQKTPDNCSLNDSHECEIVESVNDSPSPKKHLNSRRKAVTAELAVSMTMGKRLRSSRIVESSEKSPIVKRNLNKRPPAADSPSLLQQKESEPSILETKRMKLEQLLSANKSLTITPVTKVTPTSPSKSSIALSQEGKVTHNHSLLNNENSQKNGNSKLQNILSNLQAKQLQTLQMNDNSKTEKAPAIVEAESSASTGSSDVIVEITRVENCHLNVQESHLDVQESHLGVQEMIINENSVCDLTGPDEVSQDPLEVESTKMSPEVPKEPAAQAIEMTPTPRKRGRPRKTPIVEADKPPMSTPVPLPVTALEERPQRSLRLMR